MRSQLQSLTNQISEQIFSRYQILWFLPLIIHAPLLTRPIPGEYHAAREVAGYFQGLAYVREPLASFFYNTPEENLSSLHFHSLLSGLLTKAGYTEGGRLVSFVAAAVALAVVGYIAYEIFGRKAGIVAPFGLIAHPTFVLEITAYQTETLSIALTTLAVLLYIRYHDRGDTRLLGVAYLSVITAISTHLWEAVILLPMVTVSLYYREFRDAALTIVVGVGTVAMAYSITLLQPRGASSLSSYGTMTNGHWQLLLDPTWWLLYFPLEQFPMSILTQPLSVVKGLTLPMGVVGVVFWGVRGLRKRELRSWLMSSWFVSGLAIPLTLSRGYLGHDYYIWALFVPLALTFGWGTAEILHRFKSVNVSSPVSPVNVVLAVIVVVAMVPSMNFVANSSQEGFAISGNKDLTAVNAGTELRSYNIEDPDDIAFVGLDRTEHLYRYSFVSRTLIYSGILVRHRSWGPPGPSVLNSTDELTDEQVVVFVENGTVRRV